MRINKISAYLGFAIKSGKVIFGYDNLFVSKKKPNLVLVSNELNDKMKDKIANFCEKQNIVYKFLDISISDLIARDNCKVIALLDTNLSSAIMNEMEIEK